MRHILPNGDHAIYSVAILVRNNSFRLDIIKKHISDHIQVKDVIIFNLEENSKGNAPVSVARGYLQTLLPALVELGTKYLFVTDSDYYKVLTGKKVSTSYGYVNPCIIKGFESFKVITGINPKSFYYNPLNKEKSDRGIASLNSHISGSYVEIGKDIIHSAQYPDSYADIKTWVEHLHNYPVLTCDVEAFSLKHTESGIGTISFAWDKHNGIAFCCDYKEVLHLNNKGHKSTNYPVRQLLLHFFKNYKGKLIYHNANYDVKVLIYYLFMQKEGDVKGLIQGLEVMTRSIEDTKLIAYLATNTTAGNILGLKPITHEYTGDYSEEVTDIRLLNKKNLLEYNLKDCLATWYAFEKYYPIMVQDNQEELYKSLQLPRVKVCLQMELNGMPMDALRVREAKIFLTNIQADCQHRVIMSPLVLDYERKMRKRQMVVDNLLLKKKQHPLSHYDYLFINLNSGKQLGEFLYDELGFKCTKFTKGNERATGNKIITALAMEATDPAVKSLLADLVEYIKVTKLITSFIPAFENATPNRDGRSYLYGNFQVGGTVSNRLSCKDPNLQQIPSNSSYAKYIKECFVAPDGWVFAGSDFNALESTIGAKITQDPNRMKVFTDGYDSHMFNAYHYFTEEFAHVPQSVEEDDCFTIEQDGETLYLKGDTMVVCLDGKERTIKEYYETR